MLLTLESRLGATAKPGPKQAISRKGPGKLSPSYHCKLSSSSSPLTEGLGAPANGPSWLAWPWALVLVGEDSLERQKGTVGTRSPQRSEVRPGFHLGPITDQLCDFVWLSQSRSQLSGRVESHPPCLCLCLLISTMEIITYLLGPLSDL